MDIETRLDEIERKLHLIDSLRDEYFAVAKLIESHAKSIENSVIGLHSILKLNIKEVKDKVQYLNKDAEALLKLVEKLPKEG